MRTLSRHRRMTEFDPQLVIRKHSLDSSIGLSHRLGDGNVVSFLHCMKTPTGGSHGKLHPTTKVLSDAWRRGGSVAARSASAAVRAHAARWRAPSVCRVRPGGRGTQPGVRTES